MKLAKIASILGAALLLTVSAFAANKGSLQLLDSASVGATQLKAGDYSVKWEGNGPDVELSILQGSKVIATTPARLVDLNQSANSSSAVVKTNSDGSRSLSQIQFAGKKYALDVQAETARSNSAGSQ